MGTPHDAALGLPLGPTNIDGEDVLDDPFDFDFVGTTPPIRPNDGTKPGATTACRTDAASSSNVTDAKHRAAIAYSKLLRTLTTQEQKDAACDYMAVELEVMDLLEGGAA